MSQSDSEEELNEIHNNYINELIEQSKNLSLTDKTDIIIDKYTKNVLKEQYELHYNYVKSRKESSKKLNIKFRFPSIPEDITENIIKFIIHKLGDTTSSWNCKGDLFSKKEGIQECKCFTSNGPISFTPSSNWDYIYFLDARNWIDNTFILYKAKIKRTSDEWKQIKINKKQTFEDQCVQKRRPRIGWENLYPQITTYCEKIYESTFDDIIKE